MAGQADRHRLLAVDGLDPRERQALDDDRRVGLDLAAGGRAIQTGGLTIPYHIDISSVIIHINYNKGRLNDSLTLPCPRLARPAGWAPRCPVAPAAASRGSPRTPIAAGRGVIQTPLSILESCLSIKKK